MLYALFASSVWAQTAMVSGIVTDEESSKPLPGIEVKLIGTNNFSQTDPNGKFKLFDVKPGNYQISFSSTIITQVIQNIQVEAGKDLDLGTIQTKQDLAKQTSQDINQNIFSEADFDDESDLNNIPSILNSSRDIFLRTAGFTLGAARFRIRGYQQQYSNVHINGLIMNDPEDGRTYWSAWGGLNDVTRYQNVQNGLDYANYTFGNVGGATNINMRAGDYRKGTRITVSGSNRSYVFRSMATLSTGMLNSGWAFTGSISKRYSNEGYVDGVFYDAYAFFVAAEKKLAEKHSINLAAYSAPIHRGQQSASVQEVYDLTGDNTYNPNWGYQNGEKRNSRTFKSNRPTFILSHYFDINKQTTLTTSASYILGHETRTALDWADAPDPRPDYYRYLPSWYNQLGQTDAANLSAQLWKTDDSYRQINFDKMIEINQSQPDGRAQYIIENRIESYKHFQFNSVLNHKLNDHISIDAGVNYRNSNTRYYKTVNDLLGGSYYLNIDKFAIRDFPNNNDAIQNDLEDPNRKVTKDGEFGYDYEAHIQTFSAFAQTTINLNKVDLFFSGKFAKDLLWRTGNVQNGKFPDGTDSKGDSKKLDYSTYGIKAGLTYKIDGRNYVYANGGYMTIPPTFRNSFLSPRTRNEVAAGLTEEKITSAEVGYIYRSPKWKGRFSLYQTMFQDQTSVRSFYFDGSRSFVNKTLTGIDKRHRGVELGIEYNLTPEWTVTGVMALGEHIYTKRPTINLIQDNNATPVLENQTVYIKNFYESGTPQNAGSLGLKYSSPKYWFAGFNANYFADNYIGISEVRRTIRTVDGITPGSSVWNDIVDQEKFDDAFTIDVYAGKSWRIRKYRLRANISVQNVLNDKSIRTGGYEQSRLDGENFNSQIGKFASKYYYMYGTTFFANIALSF